LAASLFAMFLYLTLYLQNYLGHSPFDTGLIYLPITVLIFVFSGNAGALIGRVATAARHSSLNGPYPSLPKMTRSRTRSISL
jgi:hypothetical protein